MWLAQRGQVHARRPRDILYVQQRLSWKKRDSFFRAIGATLEALIAASCRLARMLSCTRQKVSMARAVGSRPHVPRNPVVTRAAENSRTNRIIGVIWPLLPLAFLLSLYQSGRWLVGAVGIELLYNFTKSRVFTVLPTANQMNWSQMELSFATSP